MAASDFTGMRKVTIKDTSSGGEGDFYVLPATKIGSDGFMAGLENNEVTTSTFAGDTTSVTGTNISPSTISIIPQSIDDIAGIWPEGYDETQDSWQAPIGGCLNKDVTFVFEKVCDTKANFILRHAEIGIGSEFSVTRDDTTTLEVTIYPQTSLGSEYGLTGDKATEYFAWQIFNGVYDPATDTIAYDSEAS